MTDMNGPADPPDELDARTVYDLPPAPCLRCRQLMRNASTTGELAEQHTPKPDDVAVCVCCGYAQAYTDDPARFRVLTADEASAPEVRRAVAAILAGRMLAIAAGRRWPWDGA